ncbi:MAG: CDP-diacylglycerol O-phosphatidyltransferase [Acidobacteria bacterium]|nr:CDP-diacylglycerol O-phosphatidyltransferase [Acidobacteriota bacterium]
MIPWLAHLYTALGTGTALAAALATFAGNFREAFIWLALAVLIDGTDGVLARALRVKERLPFFDGARLDDIIDYQTYVFVPVLLMLRAELLPPGWGVGVGLAILLASAYGFSRTDAKIAAGDYFFTGFPSYWNIVALYLYVWRLPRAWAAFVLLVFVALVFVPIRYVYPSRTVAWRGLTTALGAAWGALMLWTIWRLPAIDGPWAMLSLVFPVYYTALSLWLSSQIRRA